ncbi:MAG: hypothetical protein GXO94_09300 [Nitrospirae bacterium]|nr:hypothetical protein [Nitrospirota bacterium]
MRSEFRTLFEVEILHNYYKSGVSGDFRTEPSTSCLGTLEDHALLFRRTAGGFAVMYETSGEGTTEPLKPLNGEIKLSFILTAENPFLLNYTDLPLQSPSAHIYHLHNMNDNQQDGDLLLTSGTSTAYVSTEDRLELRPRYFRYSADSAGPSSEVEIRDERGRLIHGETVRVMNGKLEFPVDLRRREPGRFSLGIDGTTALEFYASDELAGRGAFGVIEIFVNDDVPPSYRFTAQGGGVTGKRYSVKFDRRRTYWKYLVVLKYRKDAAPEDLSVSYPDPAVTFGREELQTLSDGTKAVPFVSNVPLPMQSEPVKGIQLKKDGGNGIFEIENLPNPSVRLVRPGIPDDRVYSDIYVYV